MTLACPARTFCVGFSSIFVCATSRSGDKINSLRLCLGVLAWKACVHAEFKGLEALNSLIPSSNTECRQYPNTSKSSPNV